MSIRAIMWAFDAKTGSSPSKLVLIKLADNANDAGKCWPSIRHIAQHTELCERTVRSHLQRLEKIGLITVERRMQDGVNLPNVYQLNMAQDPAARPEGDAGGWGRRCRRVGQEMQEGTAGDAYEPSLEPSKEPSREDSPPINPPPSGGDDIHDCPVFPDRREQAVVPFKPKPPAYPEPFEAFWQQYPRRVGKRAALKAWQAALKRGESHEAIMAGVHRYAGERDGQDQTFTAHPATWLNQNRWEDDPGVNRPPQRVNGQEMSFVDYARRAVENADENHRRLTEGRRARKGVFSYVQ